MGAIDELLIAAAEDISDRTGAEFDEVMEDLTAGEYGGIKFLADVYNDGPGRILVTFADSFWTDFWSFMTSDPEDLIETIRDVENDRPHDLNPAKHKLVYSSDMDDFLDPEKIAAMSSSVILTRNFTKIKKGG